MNGYDYVVVGGGTAGSVLAARLSEDPAARVLLLEAGPARPTEDVSTPGNWLNLRGTSADWADRTVEQPGLGRAIDWPHGRGLGGTSNINGMVFARGHRASYDAWADAGAKGWGFDDLLPYFRRTETAVGRDSAVRGTDGPLIVQPTASRHPATAAGLAAAVQVGHRWAVDISGGLEDGFGWVDINVVDGRRQTAADAYLRPVLDRANLQVITGALVTRILVHDGRCTGVEYTAGGVSNQVKCSGEVVLAAGTIDSARLLLLSGIGPADHLREVGIDVVLDLPGVGANLHDHPLSVVAFSARQPIQVGTANHIEGIGLLRSDPGLPAPDLQTLFITPASGDNVNAFALTVGLQTPHSRGSLRLASADPKARPLLDPGYLADERDVAALVSGVEKIREIGWASALDPWRAGELVPGPNARDRRAVEAFIRASLQSIYHYVGTCRIGTDPMAVVDTDLRVRGVEGVRVADASVMPSVPTANTYASVLAIAERAAALMTT
ncbi:FAD-dependent oxidoreductase [Phytohabitans flavus]|uniref:Choline dehydrogenase n=1 Tax=Phytohabitans flavus TaxID=1076124 RepID=A0A6F8XLR4_9ACTN|nr:GMC family oxidoreductase N-terminal domain-containing protein [Phytohabitans flavus]BCB74747.1 choline dehydrogenase [Phytohabitans flavus]